MPDYSDFAVALTNCFYCLEGSDILINSRLTPTAANHVRKFHGKVCSMEPCSKCRDYMKDNIILLTIDESKSDEGWQTPPQDPDKRRHWIPNPYRAGGFVVVRPDFIERVFNPPELVQQILKYRWSFIEHEAAIQLGLLEPVEPPASAHETIV